MEQKKLITHVENVIILLIILFLLFLLIKKYNYKSLKETDNVDVFNIEYNIKDSVGNPNDKPGNNNVSDITNIFEGEDEKLKLEKIYPMPNFNIEDNNKSWNSQNELKIFSNPAYDFESIIAPGTSNTYQFIVNNNNMFNIEYAINLIETNKYAINMKYKLKRNGKYIYGSSNLWVNAVDVKKENLSLNANSHDTYELEWKWIDNDNDTKIAINEANYLLKIEINAKSN